MSADHATGATVRSQLIYSWPDLHVVLSPYLEAKAMLGLELSYSGGSLLLGKTSKSTAELCPPYKRARNEAVHNIYHSFSQEDHSRNGTELSEYF